MKIFSNGDLQQDYLKIFLLRSSSLVLRNFNVFTRRLKNLNYLKRSIEGIKLFGTVN